VSRRSEWEESLYNLGELLHMPVYKIKEEMPLSELIGWSRHFAKVKEPVKKEMTAEEVLAKFGCLPLK
jgi:hypothetical protein